MEDFDSLQVRTSQSKSQSSNGGCVKPRSMSFVSSTTRPQSSSGVGAESSHPPEMRRTVLTRHLSYTGGVRLPLASSSDRARWTRKGSCQSAEPEIHPALSSPRPQHDESLNFSFLRQIACGRHEIWSAVKLFGPGQDTFALKKIRVSDSPIALLRAALDGAEQLLVPIEEYVKPDVCWLVSPLASCGTLEQLVLTEELLAEQNLVLTEKMIWYVLGRLSVGLQHIHSRGFMHRGVSCDNILIVADGSTVLAGHSALCRTSLKPRGPPTLNRYLAPEMLLSREQSYGTAVDIWGLAATLYAMLCKRLPFSEVAISAVPMQLKAGASLDLPREIADAHTMLLVNLFRSCAVRDPATRPQASDISRVCKSTDAASRDELLQLARISRSKFPVT